MVASLLITKKLLFYLSWRSRKRLCLIKILSAIILSVYITGRAFPVAMQSYSTIAKNTIPGVVNIRTKTYIRKDPALDLYQFFLNGRVPQGEKTTSLGSGVIINGNGYIVTNYHVIKDADKIEVLFAQSKESTQVTIVGVDRKTDLALLKVKASGKLTPLTLGDSNKLEIGDIVLAIGNPFGYSHTVTSGIISAKGRVIGTGPYDNFLQTDATIHPGNSGGPLIDIRGRVIGINTAISAKGSGIGFAIPINIVKTIIKDLIRYGKVKRPWLGIMGKNILSQEDVQHSMKNSGIYGVIVSNLVIDGPAHRAGVKIGDLIMNIGEDAIYDLNHLQRILTGKKTEAKLKVRVYRKGQGFLFLSLDLEEVPPSKDLPQEADLF